MSYSFKYPYVRGPCIFLTWLFLSRDFYEIGFKCFLCILVQLTLFTVKILNLVTWLLIFYNLVQQEVPYSWTGSTSGFILLTITILNWTQYGFEYHVTYPDHMIINTRILNPIRYSNECVWMLLNELVCDEMTTRQLNLLSSRIAMLSHRLPIIELITYRYPIKLDQFTQFYERALLNCRVDKLLMWTFFRLLSINQISRFETWLTVV